jgi:tRNA threonylcarbamoyladenosine biosynthesis protein TsaE
VRAALRTATPDATAALGAALAPLLEPGDVVALAGPLGAGKTRLVQGIAAGLGVVERVTSPTFVLVRQHHGRLPLLHCDAYRLERTGDLAALDDNVLAPDVVTCVEWGDAVAAALPSVRLDVTLAPDAGAVGDAGAGAAPRSVVLEGHGPAWARRWPAVEAAVAAVAA